ncbi:MAG: hypothetical protein ACLFUI_05520 [Halanaerobiales bacterium]
MNIFKWVEEQDEIELCTSDQFIYEDMESQSGYLFQYNLAYC